MPPGKVTCMAGFSIVNLRTDVEDSAPKFGFAPALKARFAKSALESKHLGVSLQRIAPDEVSPFAHRHGQQAEELYVVLAGNGRVKLDDEYRDIAEWDVVRVEGSILRSFEAGSEGLELLAFGEIHPQDAEIVTPDAAS